MKEHRIARLDEIPEQELHVVQVEGKEIGLMQMAGRVHAFENQCAHQGGPICYGEVLGKVEAVLNDAKQIICERFSEKEYHLVCPWHGWEYDIETGVNAADPRWSIRKFDTVVRDGDVYVVI